MAYLYMAFLLIAGAAIGGFIVFLRIHKRTKEAQMQYEHARQEMLDLQKELRDVAVEQINLCSDHVRSIYAARQEDVVRYVNGTNASLQLINELMGKMNEALQVIPDMPQAAKTHIDRTRGIADEIRTLLNAIKFENLGEVIAAMEASEAKALHSHHKLEQQQESLNERA